MPFEAVIFDYGFTLSSEYYFNIPHPEIPSWKELIQDIAFRDKDFADRWMMGRAGLRDVANGVHSRTGIHPDSILHYLREGCRCLAENPAVMRFARKLKSEGVPIALVTVNFDVFNEVVVPSHGYDRLFRVIVNSFDIGKTDKTKLWPHAFRKLGPRIGYHNSLLVEDSETEVRQFRENGGTAVHYRGDRDFLSKMARLGITEDGIRPLLSDSVPPS